MHRGFVVCTLSIHNIDNLHYSVMHTNELFASFSLLTCRTMILQTSYLLSKSRPFFLQKRGEIAEQQVVKFNFACLVKLLSSYKRGIVFRGLNQFLLHFCFCPPEKSFFKRYSKLNLLCNEGFFMIKTDAFMPFSSKYIELSRHKLP